MPFSALFGERKSAAELQQEQDGDMVILLASILIVAGMVVLLRPWPFFLTSEKPDALNEWQLGAEFGKWVAMRASALGLRVRGVARLVALECPRCKRYSNYFVYPDEICDRCWRASIEQGVAPAEQHRLQDTRQEVRHPR